MNKYSTDRGKESCKLTSGVMKSKPSHSKKK